MDVFSAEGEAHDRLRRALRVAYTRERADAFVPDLAACVAAAARGLAAGERLPFLEIACRLVFEQYGLVMTGRPTGASFDDARTYAETLMKVALYPPASALLHLLGYTRAKRRIVELASEVVREA